MSNQEYGQTQVAWDTGEARRRAFDRIVSVPRPGGSVMSRTTTDSAQLLGAVFSGQVLGPGDPGYDEARRIHNGLIDKRPALIARCLHTADVVDAVNFGREEGLEISVRGGGHNVAGKAVTDGGLMIDLSLMKGIHVDPARPRRGRRRASPSVSSTVPPPPFGSRPRAAWSPAPGSPVSRSAAVSPG